MKNKKKVTEFDVIEVVRTQAQKLLKRPNISSVGVGFKEVNGVVTDDLSVQFTVDTKYSPERLEIENLRALPTEFKTISGLEIPVDVIERSYKINYEIVSDPENDLKNEELTTRQQYRAKHDPIVPGISVSNVKGTAGTIGAIVFDNSTGQPYILSNWHVLHGPNGEIGDSIAQPGPYDENSIRENIVGKLIKSHLGLAGDCAISSIENRKFNERIFGLNVFPKRTAKVNLGDKVVKSGRTTGITYGLVKRVNVVVKINYGGNIGIKEIGGFEIGVNSEKPPIDGEVSMGGDSGSLWLIDHETENDIAVGLHFAGESDPSPTAEHAIACNIHNVLSKLDVSFIDSGEILLSDEDLWNEVFTKLDSISNRISYLENVTSLNLSRTGERIESSHLEGLPVYGNWCGPGHGGGNPVDDVDQACMVHDKCYEKNGYFDCNCDADLIKALDKAIKSSNITRTGRVMAPLIKAWFTAQPCAYHTAGIPIPGGTGGTAHAIKAVTHRGKKLWKKIKKWF